MPCHASGMMSDAAAAAENRINNISICIRLYKTYAQTSDIKIFDICFVKSEQHVQYDQNRICVAMILLLWQFKCI